MSDVPVGEPSTSTEFLRGGGQLGEFIRAKDWSQSPVGAPESWPQSLRTAVSLCLASNFPINIIWGPEHTQIYNDGYRVVCGDVHPRALGENFRVTWDSAWPAIGLAFERALSGETTYLENQRMFLFRNGYLEETFFTFGLSPIRDETGGIGGLFHPATETTATMLSERRTRALRDLSNGLALLGEESAVARETVEALSSFDFDLPFVLYYQLDPAERIYRLSAQTGIGAGLAASPVQLSAEAEAPWPVAAALAAQQVVQVDDTAAIIGDADCGPYPEVPQRAFVVPLAAMSAHDPPAFLVAGASSRLPFNDAYRSFYQLIGATVSNALSTARSREDERQRAAALAELDRAKTTFFANVSHEFRTPLTLMLGPLEEILRGDALAEENREQLVTIHRNGLRLLRLVNALLDFSRVEAGRADANFEPTALSRFTAEVASNFRSACEDAGLTLTVDCPDLDESVYVDRDMWEKIVLNLVSNAFKFTFDGAIKVVTRRDGSEAVLTVGDTGTGIAPHELSRIFERFHRIEGARGRSHEGSGIGLALVQELVHLHGGRIDVESLIDSGTTFTVRVPFGSRHLPSERVGVTRTLHSTSTRADAFVEEARRWLPDVEVTPVIVGDRPCVLLVDDNADMRDFVRRLLSPHYDVETAEDGERALQIMARRAADLVLTDVMMPKLDGFGLTKALRNRSEWRDVPIILLSARAGEESRVEGLDIGADDYLVKPFGARELRARVAANLQMARMRRRTEERERLARQRDDLRRRLSLAEEEERRRFSRELHDEAGQHLAALGLELQALVETVPRGSHTERHAAALRAVADKLAQDLHALAVRLRPKALDDFGLAAALATYAEEWSRRSKIAADIHADIGSQRLSAAIESALYRIVQEALTNVARHSAAGRVAIVIERRDDHVQAIVEDDGIGFDPQSIVSADGGEGLGIRGIKERARLLGGTMEIESAEGGPTTVFVRLPLEEHEPHVATS